jgi:hypothetical protein
MKNEDAIMFYERIDRMKNRLHAFDGKNLTPQPGKRVRLISSAFSLFRQHARKPSVLEHAGRPEIQRKRFSSGDVCDASTSNVSLEQGIRVALYGLNECRTRNHTTVVS